MPFEFDQDRYWAANPPHIPTGPVEQMFLYLMRCERFIKVGVASHVGHRLTTLQRTNPFPVKVATQFALDQKRYALSAERAIHSAIPISIGDGKMTEDIVFTGENKVSTWEPVNEWRFITCILGDTLAPKVLQRAMRCREDGRLTWSAIPMHTLSREEYEAETRHR